MFQLHTTSHGLHGPGARSGSCPVRILLRGHRGVGNCYRFDSFRVTSLERWLRDGKFTPRTVVDLNILGAPPMWQQLWRAFLLLLIDPSLVLSSFRMLWGGRDFSIRHVDWFHDGKRSLFYRVEANIS